MRGRIYTYILTALAVKTRGLYSGFSFENQRERFPLKKIDRNFFYKRKWDLIMRGTFILE